MTDRAHEPATKGRRTFLAGLGASAAAALAPLGRTFAGRAESAAPGADVGERFEQLVRLRASLAPEPIYMWLIGRRYAVLDDGRSFPLCAMRNCSLTRTRRRSADAFELAVLEYNYNTDFATGEWRETLTMPVTGRQVPAPRATAEVVRHEWRAQYAYHGRLEEAREFPPSAVARYGADADLTIDRRVHPPERLGAELAITQDWYLRIAPTDLKKRGWWVREVSTVRGSAAAIANTREACVPSQTSYTIIYGFQPWMQLDGVPGHVLTTAVGGKARRAADIPVPIRSLMERLDPQSLGDPQRLLPP